MINKNGHDCENEETTNVGAASKNLASGEISLL